MKRNETLLISAIIGIAVIISLLLPLIEVPVDEYYLEIHESWFEKEVHVNYPVTVEKEWNYSDVFYGFTDNRPYIYWVVPIAQNRDIDYHVDTIDGSERMVFSQEEFSKFKQGKSSDRLIERYSDTTETLSFVSNTSNVYVFVCVLGSDFENGDEFNLNVSWLFSALEEEITSYRTEIEYQIRINQRTVSKKVSIAQILFRNY